MSMVKLITTAIAIDIVTSLNLRTFKNTNYDFESLKYDVPTRVVRRISLKIIITIFSGSFVRR